MLIPGKFNKFRGKGESWKSPALDLKQFGMPGRFTGIPGILVRGLEKKFLDISYRTDYTQEIPKVKDQAGDIRQEIALRFQFAFSENGKDDVFEVIIDRVEANIHRYDPGQKSGEIKSHIKNVEIPLDIEQQVVGHIFDE
jgi:hypothetical protein